MKWTEAVSLLLSGYDPKQRIKDTMKLTLTITEGTADWEKTVYNPDPKMMDELFCGAYSHIKSITPKMVEGQADDELPKKIEYASNYQECESCSA